MNQNLEERLPPSNIHSVRFGETIQIKFNFLTLRPWLIWRGTLLLYLLYFWSFSALTTAILKAGSKLWNKINLQLPSQVICCRTKRGNLHLLTNNILEWIISSLDLLNLKKVRSTIKGRAPRSQLSSPPEKYENEYWGHCYRGLHRT